MKLLILLISFGTFIAATAQELSLDNVSPRYFDGMKEMPGNGYYTYYYTETLKKGMRKFALKFYSYDCEEVGENSIELPLTSYNGGSASNSNSVAIAFNDPKSKIIQVKSYSQNGEFLGKKSFSDNKYIDELNHSMFPVIEIYSLEDGYLIMNLIRIGMLKTNFKISRVNNDMTVVWEKEFAEDKINMIVNDILVEGNSTYITYVAGQGMTYAKHNDFVMKLDEYGEEVFKHKFEETYAFVPIKMLFEANKLIVFGPFMEDNSGKKVLGLQGIVFSEDGEKLNSVMLDWKKKIYLVAKRLKLHGYLSATENPSFLVHEIIKSKDGNYRVITELVYSLPGVGKFKLSDFLIFTFDVNLRNINIEAVTKTSNIIEFRGIAFRPSRMQKFFVKKNYSNYKFIKHYNGKDYLVYVAKEGYDSGVEIRIAEIGDVKKVKTSKKLSTDMLNNGPYSYWDVFNNNDNNISVYTFKSYTLNLYNLSFNE